jgi:hypothetical protein
METIGQIHAAAAFSQGKDLQNPLCWRLGGTTIGLRAVKKSCLSRDSNPDFSAMKPISLTFELFHWKLWNISFNGNCVLNWNCCKQFSHSAWDESSQAFRSTIWLAWASKLVGGGGVGWVGFFKKFHEAHYICKLPEALWADPRAPECYRRCWTMHAHSLEGTRRKQQLIYGRLINGI